MLHKVLLLGRWIFHNASCCEQTCAIHSLCKKKWAIPVPLAKLGPSPLSIWSEWRIFQWDDCWAGEDTLITLATLKNLCFLSESSRSVYFVQCLIHSTCVGWLNPRHHLKETRETNCWTGDCAQFQQAAWRGSSAYSAAAHMHTRTQ